MNLVPMARRRLGPGARRADQPQLGFAPAWAAPARVRALITTRCGGASCGAWGDGAGGGGLNLGDHCGDAPAAVAENRRRLAALLPQPPRWLNLVHGCAVVHAEDVVDAPAAADAATSLTCGVVCCVTMADCLPVLLADRAGRAVGVAHAGWRGLAAGVIQATVQQLRTRLGDPAARLVAYLGPAIGPTYYEVGAEVRQAMLQDLWDARAAFLPAANGKWMADLFLLGRLALAAAGVVDVQGGPDCTYADGARFYSLRRDRITGRQAALIWLDDALE
jgi:YfiH family protein